MWIGRSDWLQAFGLGRAPLEDGDGGDLERVVAMDGKPLPANMAPCVPHSRSSRASAFALVRGFLSPASQVAFPLAAALVLARNMALESAKQPVRVLHRRSFRASRS